MAIELVTFGGLHILDNDGELDWLAGQRSRAALLVYLAIERRVLREELLTVFWPESDTENARHALRQSLYQLRKSVSEEWVESRAHELVVTTGVQTDANHFSGAIESGDLESAVNVYRGPFLQGVHLVDSTSWETWVDHKRAQYSRAYRQACRDLIQKKREAGDSRGAVAVAERWVTRDPLDDEAQHRLIDCLADAGEIAEALRQYDAYVKMVGAEGLRVAPEIQSLGERLRTASPAIAAMPHGRPQAVPQLTKAVASRRRRRWVVPAVAMLAIAIVSYVSWTRASRNSRASESQTTPGGAAPVTIAVLPFSVHGGESTRYLREGMVNLLTVALDGAGTVRPADLRATLSATELRPSLGTGAPDAETIARHLGASMYLLGDAVEAGGRLQLQASIYQTGSKYPRTKAVVSGDEDSVFALADKLAAQLLAGVSDPHADRLARTASVTTSSLEAFKEYLHGDRLMRSGEFEQAADAYSNALSRDSTFAVAYYRLALAREWAPLPDEAVAAAAAARFGSRLSKRDHDLLDAFRLWRSGNAIAAEQEYREILTRYPDDIDAWFQLGEIQFHHRPLLGQPVSESKEAWARVLAYEPQNLFAITHLARIAIVEGRTNSLDSLLSLFNADQLTKDRRLVELVLLRAIAVRDTDAARRIGASIRGWQGLAAWRVAVFATAFTQNPRAMYSVVRDMIDYSDSRSLRADVTWFASLLNLASGHLAASRTDLARAFEAERWNNPKWRRDGFDAVTEWFAATLPIPYDDSTLSRAREKAFTFRMDSANANAGLHHDTGLGKPIQLEPLRNYSIGVLSLRLRDTTEAVRAAMRLQQLAAARSATMLTRDLDRGLRARLALSRKQRAEALHLLESMECNDLQGDVAATPFVARVSERYLHAQILAEMGKNQDALRWFSSIGDGSVTEVPVRPLAHLKQAEIHDRMGRGREAAVHYSQFVAAWSNADAVLQPAVTVARRRLAELKSRSSR